MANSPKPLPSKPAFEVAPVAYHSKILAELGETAKEWFCLLYSGQLQRTPKGFPFAYPSKPLLKAIGAEVAKSAAVKELKQLSLYSMFCTMREVDEPAFADHVPCNCQDSILTDPSLQVCAGPEAMHQMALFKPIHEYFRKHGLPAVDFAQGLSAEKQLEWLETCNKSRMPDVDRVVSFFGSRIDALSLAQACIVTYARHCHGVFVPGVLLAESACSVDEYVGILIAANCMIAGVFGGKKSDENRARASIGKDATLMLRFRDLADAPPATR